MKICWDNLEKLRYSNGTSRWYTIKSKNRFTYIESCKSCGEPFLMGDNGKGFCTIKCMQNGKFHTMLGKKHSSETIEKMSGDNNYWTHNGWRMKGENNPNYGKGDKIRGSKCHFWKGGYTGKGIPLYDTFAHQIEWCEKVRRNQKDLNILEVRCTYCGKWYIPSLSSVSSRIQSLKGNHTSEHRLYCSDGCKQECPIFMQRLYPKGFKVDTSREVQPELRQMVLERDGYQCIKCGSDGPLHCHHVEGIRWNPLESADVDMCITVCKDCHKAIHQKDGCKYHELQCLEI